MSEPNLHGITDATVWADEFCKRWPSALCQIEGKEGVETEENFRDIMFGWFANAIMAGSDNSPVPKIVGYKGHNARPVSLMLSDGSELEFNPDEFKDSA